MGLHVLLFKVEFLPSKEIVICFNESSVKLMKSAFYLMLKTLFVLEIFQFCPDFLVKRKNDMVGKLRLTS